jgi:hypothetical protein
MKRKPRADKGMTREEYRAKQVELDAFIAKGQALVKELVERFPWYREKLRKMRLLPRGH